MVNSPHETLAITPIQVGFPLVAALLPRTAGNRRNCQWDRIWVAPALDERRPRP